MAFMAERPEIQRSMLLMVLSAHYNGSAKRADVVRSLQELEELKRREPAPEVLQSLNNGWSALAEQGLVNDHGDTISLTSAGQAKAKELLAL